MQSDIVTFADDVVLALADRGITAWKLEFSDHTFRLWLPETGYLAGEGTWTNYDLRIEDTHGNKRYFLEAQYKHIRQESPIRPLLLDMIREGFEETSFGFDVTLLIGDRPYNLYDEGNMGFFLRSALSKKRQYDQDNDVRSTARFSAKAFHRADYPASYEVGLVIEDAHRKPVAYSAFDPVTERFTEFGPYSERSGLEEAHAAGAKEVERSIQDFAGQWNLTGLSGLHLVGVTPEAVETNPFLQALRSGPVSVGDVVLVMIPEQESERVNLLLPFMGEPREVSVMGYQGLKGEGKLVEAFLKTAGRMGLNPRRLGELERQAFRVFFRQLIHNISGVPLEEIRPDDLVDFERALRRLRSA